MFCVFQQKLGSINDDGDNMICDNSLAKEQFAKINMHEQDDHVGKQYISNKDTDVVIEGLDVDGQHDSDSRGVIDGTKNCVNLDSPISNIEKFVRVIFLFSLSLCDCFFYQFFFLV